MNKNDKEKLALELVKIGCVKFGEFILKSGLKSPVYIDLRILVSYPKTLKLVGQAFAKILKTLRYDRIAAIPYAALPLAASASFAVNKPWIYTRKEVKDHGIKKPIEGLYKKGEKVVIIDDLITYGDSKLEVIKPIINEGLKVKDIVVLVDREQGGKEHLAKKGYHLHAVYKISDWLKILKRKKKISNLQYKNTIAFLRQTKIK